MTIRTSRRRIAKPPADRRRDILDAAVRVFSHKGIPHTTVADITEAAGVAKGTFYLYFDSRDHLLAALRERFMDDMMAHATPFIERIGKGNWWSLAEETVESIIDFTLQHGQDIVAFMQEQPTPETRLMLAECERKPIEYLALGVQAGIDAGHFEVEDPWMTASFIFHALEGTAMARMLYDDELDRDRIVTAAKALFLKLLRPQAELDD